MLRRFALLLALVILAAPASSRAHEWEEDYTDDWTDQGPPPGSDPVDVDVDIDASVSFDTFQGALAPYGQWVVVGGYGRVWRPQVAAGWRPYYYGRWEWTNEGWLWVSDEPWGWAAYHYGRWTMDPYHGWVWVPGYQWAPAWVSWRYSGDVVGWAPLGPGVSVYVSVTTYHDHWWTFVPCRSFVAHPVHRIAYQPSHTRRYWHATAPAPAYRGRPSGHAPSPAWGGPPPRTIEQRIGRPVRPVRVVAAPSPGAARVRDGEVAMYRPGQRGSNGLRSPDRRAGVRDDGRSAPLRSDDARPGHGLRADEARPAPGFRANDARRGPSFGGDHARPQVQTDGDRAGATRDADRFRADDRSGVDQARGWNRPDRGAPTAAPTPAPTQRQEAPRFSPRGWNGPAASQDAAPAAPRAQRSWGQAEQGGGFRRGGGDGGGAPRAMAPRVGGGDRGGGGERRGHR